MMTLPFELPFEELLLLFAELELPACTFTVIGVGETFTMIAPLVPLALFELPLLPFALPSGLVL